MCKILITGGSGFIGTNIILDLLKCEYSVLNLDIKKSRIPLIQNITSNIDIEDLNDFRSTVIDYSPDYIIHLAARTDLDGMSIDDYSANTVGVNNLLLIVSELPNLKKIIITSSMLVCKAGYSPQHQLDYSPTTLYGESKVITEKKVWENKPHCDWAIIRPTSIWGPWFGIPYKSFFDMVISRKYFHIGNRSCTKTYGYIGNSIYQIKQILFNETIDENNKIFYIGDSPATNIEEWGNEIAHELGCKIMKVPYFVMKFAALLGDVLKLVDIRFPMTSFRLKNMTTDNVVNLKSTYQIAPNPPYSRIVGVKSTLAWIKNATK